MGRLAKYFDFRDASIWGDPNWSSAFASARYAPCLVIFLLVLSVIEIVMGVVWITSFTSLSGGFVDLSFAQVIQPIIIPGLSFFNTVPSLHLHVLARSNKPLLAMTFSTLLAILFLASAVIWIVPCAGGDASLATTSTGTRRSLSTDMNTNSATKSKTRQGVLNKRVDSFQANECPYGNPRGLWAAIVALQFFSAVGYMIHAAVAWRVRSILRKREIDVREGRVVIEIDEHAKQRREELARERWRELADFQG